MLGVVMNKDDHELEIPSDLDRRTIKKSDKSGDANDQPVSEVVSFDQEVTEIESHPYADMFPRMQGDEFKGLVASIKKDRQEESIILYDGKILDGRNRHAACIEAGVEPRCEPYEGEDPLGYVLRKNLHRRQLQTSQRAIVAAKMANLPQGARTDLEHSANLQKVSVEEAAKTLSVSPRSVQDAKTVLACGGDELIAAVESGKKTVSAAARKILSPSQPVENTTEGERQSECLLKLWNKTGSEGQKLFRKAIGADDMVDGEES
jgi:ParB-like chromosome segregation protein Spo0J